MRATTALGTGVSGVLVTRNRAETALRTMQSILSNDHPDFELIVVDQSDSDALARMVPRDDRLRYVRSEERGLSAGRNLAVSQARHEVVVCTDDDCQVPTDWLSRSHIAVGAHPHIGLVLGSVLAAAHNRDEGFVPAHVQARSACARSVWQKNRADGMGACMVLRRSVWERLGGFDRALGAGARHRAGEELDLALRALHAGFWVCAAPDLWVEHHGFRQNGDAARLISGYWHGTGAAFAKSFRRSPLATAYVLAGLAARSFVRRSPIASSVGASAHDQLRGFWAGWSSGLAAPLDVSRELFLP